MTKKYDLRKIMRRAWEIKFRNRDNIFGLCLKMAWEEEKAHVAKKEARVEKKAAILKLRDSEIKSVSEMKLPELTGSEKQVAWAKKIRNRVQRTFIILAKEEEYTRWFIKKDGEYICVQMQEAFDAMRKVLSITESKWWIESTTIYEKDMIAMFV